MTQDAAGAAADLKKRLTVISPVYNEEDGIRSFYDELKRCLSELEPRYRSTILFVLDRCTDNTLAILRDIADRDSAVKCLVMSSRFGHQMALLAGIDHANADVYVMMDSDLQHPPSVIKEMTRTYEQGFDVVYTVRKEVERQGIWRKFGGKIFYSILRRLSDAPIHENAADFRLVTDKVARVFRNQIRERNMFMRGLVGWVGFNQKALEYVAAPRFAGRSKYSMTRMLRLAADALVSFSSFPLRLSLIVGVLFSVAGFLYALLTAFQYFVHTELPSGWATLVILITIYSGVQLICLGMVGAYVGAIYSEVKNRPHYIVDELINFPDRGDGQG
jgi:glycosyltransferase involved in cell wall biosynthesis